VRSLRQMLAVVVLSATAVTAASAETSARPENWDGWNKGLDGSRYAANESRITPRTAGQLRLRWAFQLPRVPNTMGKSQPAVVDGRLYVGSTDGTLHAMDAKTAAPLWTFDTTTVAAADAVHGAAIWNGPRGRR
jgi:polyvinyl alcohol dehydrogenase (cytochrome)